jgi:hypothetical protein
MVLVSLILARAAQIQMPATMMRLQGLTMAAVIFAAVPPTLVTLIPLQRMWLHILLS